MALENMKLVHACSSEHLRRGTVRLKSENETEEENKEKRMKMERSKMGGKKIPRAYLDLWPTDSLRCHNSSKQWMNCITNLTYR